MTEDNNIKFGFVAVVGPPNAGKSTLVNYMIGHKVAITSRKPQTTRHRIIGIKTTKNAQIVFVDTPGIHETGKNKLNKMINKAAISSLEDVDAVLFMMDDRGWNAETQLALAAIGKPNAPVLLLINKIDKLKDKDQLLPLIADSQQRLDFTHIIPLSVKRKQNIDDLQSKLIEQLPSDGLGFGFPEDQITDKSQRFLAAELVREQIFRQLGQELPYSTAVEVNSFEFKDDDHILATDMTIWVDRKGQKGILVGKNGERLKEIGIRARKQMQLLFGKRTHVSLWVKVRKGWADNAAVLKSFGYGED